MLHSIAPAMEYSNTEIINLESFYKTQLNNDLKRYLGDVEFNVFLKSSIDEVGAEATNKEKPQEDLYISGLLPTLTPKALQTEKLEKRYTISKVALQIHVFKNIPESAINVVKDIAMQAMGNIPASVNVKFVDQFIEKESSKEVASKDKSFLEQHKTEIFDLIGKIVVGVMAVLGAIIFANAFKSPLGSMADSMKNYSFVKTTAMQQATSNAQKEAEKPVERKPKEVHPFHHELFFKNLEIFKQVLKDSPQSILETINQDSIGFLGMKPLLVYLETEDLKENLKSILSGDSYKNLLKTNSQEIFPEQLSFYTWFNQFVENLILLTIGSGNKFLGSVDKKSLTMLYLSDKNKLMEYLTINRNKISLKLIVNFLDENARNALVESFSETDWELFINDQDIIEDDIKSEVTDIERFLFKPEKAGEKGISSTVVVESIILPSVVAYLKRASIQQGYDRIQLLKKDNSWLVEQVHAEVWTAAELLRIPTNILAEQIKETEVTLRKEILIPMPADVRDYLLSAFPEGNAKKILTDELKRQTNIVDENVARSFIDTLRVKFKEGAFKFVEAPAIEAGLAA